VNAIEALASTRGLPAASAPPRHLHQLPMDLASAMERVDGSVELLKEMVALFLEEIPGLLATLHEAIKSGNARSVERAAHKLKGSVSNFSAQPSFEIALKLETAARDGNLSAAGPAFVELELEITRLKSAMANLDSLEKHLSKS